MKSPFLKTSPNLVTMGLAGQRDARRQQAHRRLRELELAARLGDGPELAWHIVQAVRSGVSPAEVTEAVTAWTKMHGTPVATLTHCTSALKMRTVGIKRGLRLHGQTDFEAQDAG